MADNKGNNNSSGQDDEITEVCMGVGAALGSVGGPAGIALGTGLGWIVGIIIKESRQ